MLAKPQVLDEAFEEGLRPDPDLTLSQWADKHRRLTTESSAERGQWRTRRVPYMREIQDAQSPRHPGIESALMKGTQIAGSECMYNAILYYMDLAPCPILLVQPTIDVVKLTSEQRIQPAIENTACLVGKVAPPRARDGGNKKLLKKFHGGILRLTGANSGPGLRSMPVRLLLLDEVDAYPVSVEDEGDPVSVAKKRTDTFGRRRKIFAASSPKIKDASRIEKLYKAGTQARYYVPCPFCEHLQVLRWQQMRWAMYQRREFTCRDCGTITEIVSDSGIVCRGCGVHGDVEHTQLVATEEVERAWYECERCEREIEERWKDTIFDEWPYGKARHVHENPGPGTFLEDDDRHPWAIWVRDGERIRRFLPKFQRPLSWHVSGLYSPLGWYSWKQAVTDYLEAKRGGHHEKTGEPLLQVFYNTILGEPYEVEGNQADHHVLENRREAYDMGTVPAGGLWLVQSADIQGNWIEYKTKAYGRGEESWLVDHGMIHGDTSRTGPGSVWEKLAEYRDKGFMHASGNTLRAVAMGVDSGYQTQLVYDFCRTWGHKHVIALKGDDGPGKPAIGPERKVDYSPTNGKAIKGGASVRIVGLDTVKEHTFRCLAIEQPGPGYMHLPRDVSTEYLEGLTSEKQVRTVRKGKAVNAYVKTRDRNEPFDLENYCYATAVYAGLKRINWDELERVINPKQLDIFAQGAAPRETTEVQTPAQPTSAAEAAPAGPAGTDAADTHNPPAGKPQEERKGWLTRRKGWLGR